MSPAHVPEGRHLRTGPELSEPSARLCSRGCFSLRGSGSGFIESIRLVTLTLNFGRKARSLVYSLGGMWTRCAHMPGHTCLATHTCLLTAHGGFLTTVAVGAALLPQQHVRPSGLHHRDHSPRGPLQQSFVDPQPTGKDDLPSLGNRPQMLGFCKELEGRKLNVAFTGENSG